jgi:hypothetical protein
VPAFDFGDTNLRACGSQARSTRTQAGLELDVFPAQRHQLAAAQAGVEGDRPQRPLGLL